MYSGTGGDVHGCLLDKRGVEAVLRSRSRLAAGAAIVLRLRKGGRRAPLANLRDYRARSYDVGESVRGRLINPKRISAWTSSNNTLFCFQTQNKIDWAGPFMDRGILCGWTLCTRPGSV